MRVAELIAALQALPPDMPVMVRGYEGGYDDCDAPEVRSVELNVNSEDYYGEHDDPRNPAKNAVVQAAIIL